MLLLLGGEVGWGLGGGGRAERWASKKGVQWSGRRVYLSAKRLAKPRKHKRIFTPKRRQMKANLGRVQGQGRTNDAFTIFMNHGMI